MVSVSQPVLASDSSEGKQVSGMLSDPLVSRDSLNKSLLASFCEEKSLTMT